MTLERPMTTGMHRFADRLYGNVTTYVGGAAQAYDQRCGSSNAYDRQDNLGWIHHGIICLCVVDILDPSM
jgi:hypothetical protein